jgi:hypothetical protein
VALHETPAVSIVRIAPTTSVPDPSIASRSHHKPTNRKNKPSDESSVSFVKGITHLGVGGPLERPEAPRNEIHHHETNPLSGGGTTQSKRSSTAPNSPLPAALGRSPIGRGCILLSNHLAFGTWTPLYWWGEAAEGATVVAMCAEPRLFPQSLLAYRRCSIHSLESAMLVRCGP